MAEPGPYTALAMQLTAQSTADLADADAVRAQIVAQICEVEAKLGAAKGFIDQYGGVPVRLAVLPEYLFTSYPVRISISEFASRAGFWADGPEYTALGAAAERLGLYLSGNAYECDAHFPGFYFQTSFIIAPSGDVVLRYRRLLSMFAPSPHDVWDAYLDHYGIDGVFPVADTPIGRLACVASEEILYPEVARALGFRGAEVLCHSSSEIGSPLATAKDVAKRARAFENMAYVVSANTAGIAGQGLPLASADGGSQVVGPDGKVLAQSLSGETYTAFAKVDIAALRAVRRTPAMTNSLARQRPGLFAPVYAAATGQEANAMLEGNEAQVPTRDAFLRMQQAVIDRLDRAGLI
jgi:predicted amidohydrolase